MCLLNFVAGFVSMEDMLKICSDTLPNSSLSYLAFRVSFQETLERIALSKQIQDDENECFGFLTEVPFLKAVPPHVQLDLLAATWNKHTANRRIKANLVDEAVVYATCETAARISEREPTVITHCLISGTMNANISVDELLPTELRNLHLSLSNEGDFLLISQFEDMHPDEARDLKQQFKLDESRLKVMFDALGRWTISKRFFKNLNGLLSDREIARTAAVLGEELSRPAK